MRAYLVAGLAVGCVMWSTTARLAAAEIAAASRVGAVTVYPAGAEITRQTRVTLDAGEHVVVLRDLPAQAIGASIRVEGKATGQLEIGSVDHRRTFLSRDGDADASGRRQLEREMERLRDERDAIEAVIETTDLQKAFVQNLAQLPTVPPGPQGATGSHDWGQVFGLIASRLAEAQQRALDARIKMRDLDRRIEDLSKKLAQAAPKRLEQTEVRINVAAAGRMEADLTVRYQVSDAGWQPLYDARLETGARNVAPKLKLVRRALIRQRTGEPWNDVALILSTVRPSGASGTPELRPLTVDIQQEMPRPAPAMAPPPPVAGALRSRELADGEASRKVAEAAPQIAAVEPAATLDPGAYSAAFVVKDRLTLPETGEAKTVFVEEQTIEPTLVVRSVPRLDPKAYLYARVTLPRSAPYIAGQVALFRDRTFSGTTRIPNLAPGETYELGFGADDLIRVRHAAGDERRGEAGLITSTRTDERQFRITIRNLHERPIAFSVLDHVPVSLNQDVRVDLLGKTPPSRRDVDDKRGIMAWEDRLNADEERVIEYGYRVSWPANRSIVYGR